MNLPFILSAVADDVRPLVGHGAVADYIAPLAAVSPRRFGLALRTVDGAEHSVGDADERFSIQSIAKVLSLAVAMDLEGDQLWERVGREPSGTPFNSLVQLEAEAGIPRNPMINAGALIVVDSLLTHLDPDSTPVLDLIREATGDPAVGYDHDVASAEAASGHRNRALAHYLKAFGTLRGDPDATVEAYCRLCSISLSCSELCRVFAFLASSGRSPSGRQVVGARQAKRLNAILLTCGVYDEAGDFAYRVGLPAKSGVGGGIVAILPGEFVAATWSPGLDTSGNSLAGVAALESLTTRIGRSIF